MPLTDLLQDLLEDISNPRILWQALAIVGAVAIGLLLARFIRRSWLHENETQNAIRRLSVEGFGRVLAPLLIAALVWGAKLGLQQHQSVHLLRVALPLFTSMALIRLVFYMLRRVFARHGQIGTALQTFEKILALVVWLGVALYLMGLWPDIITFLDNNEIRIGKNRPSLLDILQGAVSVVVLMMLALWAGAALEERLMGLEGLHTSSRVVLARVSRAALILVSVLVSLRLVGLDLTVLSVFGGALGVGLGLGMQRIASNYVSGFIILLERSLSIGDPITVDKYSGRVARINTRTTVLQALDGTQTLLPNEMLITGVVLNQAGTNKAVRLNTRITVAYDSDLNEVMTLLLRQADDVERVVAEPAPAVQLNAFGPTGYELELGFSIIDPEKGSGNVISAVNKNIYALVHSGAIRLGLPPQIPQG
ncbi:MULTISPECIES: mechanosensitive ion channel family protein [unclassified Massilia]|uniref:mechanosensitive ion channel family protein n=1 Tax=unclassified Massilia TaxID=2609279 RepID=UPI00177AE67A|nr:MULTISPECIES: mechanosensitive ion channel domain-containing protein [unclassified Massilia]MBD8528690.1 mechanosensitive ion channel [Massilia sp. CFBP 13647]MBD8672294.1 mechanosensitive ion channel [Massilia sp. CFBP 13721]